MWYRTRFDFTDWIYQQTRKSKARLSSVLSLGWAACHIILVPPFHKSHVCHRVLAQCEYRSIGDSMRSRKRISLKPQHNTPHFRDRGSLVHFVQSSFEYVVSLRYLTKFFHTIRNAGEHSTVVHSTADLTFPKAVYTFLLCIVITKRFGNRLNELKKYLWNRTQNKLRRLTCGHDSKSTPKTSRSCYK